MENAQNSFHQITEKDLVNGAIFLTKPKSEQKYRLWWVIINIKNDDVEYFAMDNDEIYKYHYSKKSMINLLNYWNVDKSYNELFYDDLRYFIKNILKLPNFKL